MRLASLPPIRSRDLLAAARHTAGSGNYLIAGVFARTALTKHCRDLYRWHGTLQQKMPMNTPRLLSALLRRRVIDRCTWDRLRESLKIGDRCLTGEPVHFSEVVAMIDEVQVFVDRFFVDEDELEAIVYSLENGVFGNRHDDSDPADWWKGGAE